MQLAEGSPHRKGIEKSYNKDLTGINGKTVYQKDLRGYKISGTKELTEDKIDGIDINECNVNVEDREEIDKWLLSKYNKLIKNMTEEFNNYDLNKVVHYINDFVNEDLSNWYIRRNRRRFWASELDNSKKSVYKTTSFNSKKTCSQKK